MLTRRSLTIFASTFAFVLLAGVGFAQLPTLAPRVDEPIDTAAAVQPIAEVGTTPSTVTQDVTQIDQAEPAVTTTKAVATPSAGLSATRADEQPLGITHPVDGQRFDDQQIAFEGHAPIGWTVTAAGYAAEVDAEGHWRILLILNPGANVATIIATGPDGEIQEATVTAHYDVPAPTVDTGTAADPSAFSASQRFGSKTEPFDVFSGTPVPGAVITVSSEYGSGSTVAGRKGQWEVKVAFPGAPPGESFGVVVTSDAGDATVFTFLRADGERDHDRDKHRRDGGNDRDRRSSKGS